MLELALVLAAIIGLCLGLLGSGGSIITTSFAGSIIALDVFLHVGNTWL